MPPDHSQSFIENDEISPKEIILRVIEWVHYLKTRWLVIIVAGVIGGALGLLYSCYKKPVYTSTLTFAIQERSLNSSLGAYASLAGQFGIDLGRGGNGGVFTEDNIMELMKSRRMVTKTLLSTINIGGKEENLVTYYIFINHYRQKWSKHHKALTNVFFPISVSSDSLTYIQDSLLGVFYKEIIKNNLLVDRLDKKTSIITTMCESTDQLFAKYFTEVLVRNVTAFYIQTKTKQTSSNVNILQNRLDSVRKGLNEALYGTAFSADQNLNPARAIVGVPKIRSQLEAQILGAEYAELVKNLEMAKIILLQETPLIQVIDSPVIPLPKSEMGKVEGIILGVVLATIGTILSLTIRLVFNKILVNN